MLPKVSIVTLTSIFIVSNIPSTFANGGKKCECIVRPNRAGDEIKVFAINETEARRVARLYCTLKSDTSKCGKDCECRDDNGELVDCIKDLPNCGLADCTVRCVSEKGKCVNKASGEACGDPHMSGFDGSKFNFNGLHNHNYVIYGRLGGDVLVSELTHHYDNPSTYFNRFGIQTGNSNNKFEVYFKNSDCTGDRKYCPAVLHNGNPISESETETLAKQGIRVIAFGNTIRIVTQETTFSFLARLPTTDRRYFNIKIDPILSPSASEQYLGVLGFTMNRFVGHKVSKAFESKSRKDKVFDKALQENFEVSNLFPERNDKLHSMHGIEKMNQLGKPLGLAKARAGSIKHIKRKHNKL